MLESLRIATDASSGARCPPGQARITNAFGRLRAAFVVHAVGPYFPAAGAADAAAASAAAVAQLGSAYREALRLAAGAAARSVGVPPAPFHNEPKRRAGKHGEREGVRLSCPAMYHKCERNEILCHTFEAAVSLEMAEQTVGFPGGRSVLGLAWMRDQTSPTDSDRQSKRGGKTGVWEGIKERGQGGGWMD